MLYCYKILLNCPKNTPSLFLKPNFVINLWKKIRCCRRLTPSYGHLNLKAPLCWGQLNHCYCSVTQSWPTLWDPVDCSVPGFPVFHHLLEFAQLHVHWVGDAIQPSSPLSSFLLLPSIFPSIRVFPMSWLCTSGGQSIRASISASVLPMNIQDWFPLGLTGLISLQSKGLSRVFSNTTVQKHQFVSAQPSL